MKCPNNVLLSGGEAPHWDPFNIPTLSLSKKSRKEMASLGENGQEYKCPFFKSARGLCELGLRKTHCEHNAANLDFSYKILTAHFLSVLCGKGFRVNFY